MKFQIVNGPRLLVEVPAHSATTKGGLYVLSSNSYAEASPVVCKVLQVGDGCHPKFKVGQRVLVNKISTLNMQMCTNDAKEEEAHDMLVHEPDVFAILAED